jgi:hypothetical protein
MFRRSFRRLAPAVAAAELQDWATSQLLFHKLRTSHRTVLTKATFEDVCVNCGVNPTDDFVAKLDAAGVIVNFGECIVIKPSELLRQTSLIMSKDREEKDVIGSWNPQFQMEVQLQDLINQKSPLDAQVQQACDEAAKSRRIMWGGAMAFAGTQLAVISRLTYFDLDWDVMEPVTYFLGTGTALLFYGWMLYYRTEHSYVDCDTRLINRKVQKLLKKNQFDFQKYRQLSADIQGTREQMVKVARSTE